LIRPGTRYFYSVLWLSVRGQVLLSDVLGNKGTVDIFLLI